MNKKIITAVGLLVFAFAAAYRRSPFWAIHQFKQAAFSADVDRLDAAVDFPAVREILNSELTVAMTAKMTSDPALKNNLFAGLGMMMLPAFINHMVDGFVTAEGISALVKQGQITIKANPQPAKTDSTTATTTVRSTDSQYPCDPKIRRTRTHRHLCSRGKGCFLGG